MSPFIAFFCPAQYKIVYKLMTSNYIQTSKTIFSRPNNAEILKFTDICTFFFLQTIDFMNNIYLFIYLLSVLVIN